ncbi:hypothetical protein [Sneathiella aquimaris]|uniref:hypothetical protein n=1 Tax=Sneathiella aquimaris TaxID=2599305 RepID=UPI00146D742A|nr:hypothetical protein [Sneathiella aquimaris]
MEKYFPSLEGIENDPSTPAADLLAKGICVYYGDDRYHDPDLIVEESPDATKTLPRFNGADFDILKTL